MNNNQGSQKRGKAKKTKLFTPLDFRGPRIAQICTLFRRPAIYRKRKSKKDFPNPTVQVYCSCNKQHTSLAHKARVSE